MSNFYKDEWLSHLKDSVAPEALVPGISMYTIALEGWRRGLELTFYIDENENYNQQVKYKLSNGSKTHYFDDSSGDFNKKIAYDICHDKSVTNEYLTKVNVPIPRGSTFNKGTDINEVIEFSETLTYPLVVKPVDGFAGRGVITGIKSIPELKEAINHVTKTLKFENYIVQEFLEGDEVRIYVLGNKIIGAANRRPANIVGNGKDTIRDLIEKENEFRLLVPHLVDRPIRIDTDVTKRLKNQGYTPKSIPQKDERVYLRGISNVSLGGEPIDYTDKLTQVQREIAIKATEAIPGLAQCGVDMIIQGESGVIIELNTSPGIGSHLYPIEGLARDIPRAVIDYYFPETISNETVKNKYFYNLQSVLDPLKKGAVTEITVPDHPSYEFERKELILKGNKEIKFYYTKLLVDAFKCNIHGTMRVENDLFVITSSFPNKKAKNKFYDSLMKLNLEIIQETNSKKPIMLGFELMSNWKYKSLAEIESVTKQNYRAYVTLKREINFLQKRISHIFNSRSWRISKPVRVLSRLFKKNY